MKARTKNMIVTVCICLVLVTLLGWLTQGFTTVNLKDRFAKERNEANKIAKTDIVLKDGKHANGITVKVNDDGSVTLSGTASEDLSLTYANVKLAAGTYTFTGAQNGSTGTYYMTASNNGTTTISDFAGNTFTLSAQATSEIVIHIKKDAKLFNVTLYPVLYTGDTEVEFYK